MLEDSRWMEIERDNRLPLHHFQKTLEPHLNLSFPSHSKARSSERKGTFCNNQTKENQSYKNNCKTTGKTRAGTAGFGFYLLLGKILAASEVLWELAGSKFNSVCSGKVCTGCSQSFLVVQFLL